MNAFLNLLPDSRACNLAQSVGGVPVHISASVIRAGELWRH